METPQFRRVRVVVNPRAGFLRWKKPIVRAVRNGLSHLDFEWELKYTERRGHARELSAEATEQGFDLVVAVGGDGTVNECASGLVGSDTCLAVVPVGSGNGLARGLHIPVSVRKSLRLLRTGVVRRIDAGRVDGTYFFVTAGVGFDAEVGHEFDRRDLRGPIPYFVIGVKRFFVYKPQEIRLSFEDREIVRRVLLVTAANMRQYGSGAIIAPHARPDDGTLDVCVIQEVGFLPAVYYLPRLFLGTIDTAPYVEIYRTREFLIHRSEPGPYHCDGEPFDGGEDLHVTVVPRSLSVLVPKESFELEKPFPAAGSQDAQ